MLSYWQCSMEQCMCRSSLLHSELRSCGENPFVSLNSPRWRKFKVLTAGLNAKQQRKEKKEEKKTVWKRSLCNFVSGDAFQVYFCGRGKGLFTPQRDVVGLMLLMSIVCFLFSIKNACFLHPFCDCLLRSKDLCCYWCQIILHTLLEFFGWSEFLASFLAVKHLTS